MTDRMNCFMVTPHQPSAITQTRKAVQLLVQHPQLGTPAYPVRTAAL